ncbi:MAG: type I-E CRISPR-associated protein Cse1/CasA [Bacteroidota bacterium]
MYSAVEPKKISEVARALVALQSYGLSGLAGSRKAGGRLPNYSGAPLTKGAVFWIRGLSLFEALLLNAPPSPDARLLLESDETPMGSPVWAKAPFPEPGQRVARGYIEMLTWKSRQVTILAENVGDAAVVSHVFLAPGDDMYMPVGQGALDPLMATTKHSKKGLVPLRLSENRSVWRDSEILFKLASPSKAGGPRTFSWLQEVSKVSGADRYSVSVFHLSTERGKAGKPSQWRHELMPVYPALLDSGADGGGRPLHQIREALEGADEQSRILYQAIRATASHLLASPAPGSDELPKPKTDELKDLLDALGAEPRYWAALEPTFYRFLSDLAADAESYVARQQVLSDWQEAIYVAARSAFQTSTAHIDQDARQLRAVAQGTRHLMRIKALCNRND